MNDIFAQFKELSLLIPIAIIGAVGGIVNLLVQHTKKNQPITLSRLLINGVIAAFVAAMMDVILSDHYPSYRAAIAGFTGYLSYPILIALEEHGLKAIKRHFGVKD